MSLQLVTACVTAWYALAKLDGYAMRWASHHLVQAGRKDDLRRLLLDFTYLQVKLTATDLSALISDYDYFLGDKDEDLELIQSAIRRSAQVLASDPRQLAGQLTGRLLAYTSDSVQALLQQAS